MNRITNKTQLAEKQKKTKRLQNYKKNNMN